MQTVFAMDMSYCMECGKELPEGARYCSKCGAPVALSEWEEFQVSADDLVGRVKEHPRGKHTARGRQEREG